MSGQGCEEGERLWSLGLAHGLDYFCNEAFESITNNLRKSAFFVNDAKEIELSIVTQDFPIKIPKSQRVVLLERRDFEYRFPEDIELARGAFSPSDSKIFVLNRSSCIKTIIHETLHSCSITALRPELLDVYYPVFEGLTELYAGYIFHKLYPNQAESCWKSCDMLCTMTREHFVRTFGALCHFIPMCETTRIYFAPSDTNYTFNQAVSDFVKVIHNHGFRSFQNPLDLSNVRFYGTFMSQCEKTFGKTWSSIRDSNSLYVDFDKMVIGEPM